MTGYSDEAQHVIDAVIAGDVCQDCNAPNHLRHFDDCPQHPENLTGAPASRIVDALTGEVAAAGAEHPVLAASAKADERIADFEALKAERDDLFRERDAWMELTYQVARLGTKNLVEAKRQRDDAEMAGDIQAAMLRQQNEGFRCRIDELEAEVRELRAGQAVSS